MCIRDRTDSDLIFAPDSAKQTRNRNRKVYFSIFCPNSTGGAPKVDQTFFQLWGRPLASWGNRSKNKPSYTECAPFVDNMTQEPHRYLLRVFPEPSPRFGPLTRFCKFENFQIILPSQPLGPKVPKSAHWWKVGIPPR